jgi:hypothetical protein
MNAMHTSVVSQFVTSILGYYRGIPKLMVFLVLLFFFFLIMSCFSPNRRNIFISMILLVPAKGLVLQTNNNYSFTQDASSAIY